MRAILLTPAARQDLIDALDWYENEAPGLGRRFLAEVDSVIGRMGKNPGQFPVIYKKGAPCIGQTLSLRADVSH